MADPLSDLFANILGNAAPDYFGDPRTNQLKRELRMADISERQQKGESIRDQGLNPKDLERLYGTDFAAQTIGFEQVEGFKQAQRNYKAALADKEFIDNLHAAARSYIGAPVPMEGTEPEQATDRFGNPMTTSFLPRVSGVSEANADALGLTLGSLRRPNVDELEQRFAKYPALSVLYQGAQAEEARRALQEREEIGKPTLAVNQGNLAVNQGNLSARQKEILQRERELDIQEKQYDTSNVLESQKLTALTHPDLSPADQRLVASYRIAKPGSTKFLGVERRMKRRGLLDRPGLVKGTKGPELSPNTTYTALVQASRRLKDAVNKAVQGTAGKMRDPIGATQGQLQDLVARAVEHVQNVGGTPAQAVQTVLQQATFVTPDGKRAVSISDKAIDGGAYRAQIEQMVRDAYGGGAAIGAVPGSHGDSVLQRYTTGAQPTEQAPAQVAAPTAGASSTAAPDITALNTSERIPLVSKQLEDDLARISAGQPSTLPSEPYAGIETDARINPQFGALYKRWKQARAKSRMQAARGAR